MGEVDASVFKRNISRVAFNPFVRNTRFLYPQKTSENQAVFWSFQGVEKVCIESKMG